MHPVYSPPINFILRTLLKPFAKFIPPRYQFMVTGIIKVKLPEGKRIVIACNPTSYVAKVLFWNGYKGYEYNSIRIFIHLAKNSALFIDVGANLGYYSIIASVYNPGTKVVCFEPSPGALRFLKMNIELNHLRNVTPESLALSNSTGRSRFYVTKNPKFSEIAEHLYGTPGFNEEQAESQSKTVESFDVETDTLDHYSEMHLKNKIDLLKLDTEASEHLVLKGSGRVLAEHKPIIFCEVLPGKIENELEMIFQEYDYLMFRAEPDHLLPVERLLPEENGTKEYLMAHPDTLHKIQPFIRPRK